MHEVRCTARLRVKTESRLRSERPYGAGEREKPAREEHSCYRAHTELLQRALKMELPAVGEHVFAVESIEKKRIRKVCGFLLTNTIHLLML